MKSSQRRVQDAIGVLLLAAGFAGCATTAETVDGPRIVVDGEQYITLDAPVGSHLKRRIRISDLKEPGISPTKKAVVTDDSDITVLPMTAGEMTRSMGIGGR